MNDSLRTYNINQEIQTIKEQPTVRMMTDSHKPLGFLNL
jgi:hypothetical protein